MDGGGREDLGAQRDEMTWETDGWGRSAQPHTPACSFLSCSHLNASCNSDFYSDVWVFQHHQEILQYYLNVLQLSSILTVYLETYQSPRLKTQSYKTATPHLQMPIESSGF